MRIVHSAPEFFAHQGDAPVKHGEAFGCRCARCAREVSAPFGFERQVIWCLYCGIDEGLVVAVDNPFSAHRWTFGVTREEAGEERQWIDRGADYFHRMTERRARELGRVLDIF